MKNSVENRVATGMLTACRRWPYASTAILSMRTIESAEVPTMAVDARWRLYYSPQFVESLTDEQPTFVIIHEVSHLMLGHAKRAKRVIRKPNSRAHFRWNIAADMAVNSMLQEEGFQVLDDAVMPGDMGYEPGLSAEEYYSKLLDEKGDEPEEGGDGGGVPHPGGSGSDGVPRPWEGELDDLPLGEQEEAQDADPGVSDDDAERIIAEVAKQAEKAQGKLSAGMQRLCDAQAPKPISVERILCRAVSRNLTAAASAGAGISSYRRPSRRQGIGGTLRPKQWKPSPRVWIVVDTSGSMCDSELAMALGLIARVLRSLRSSDGVQVITGDTQACTAAKVFRPDQVSLEGGGGTDMGRIIVQAHERSKGTSDLIICVTDGYTPWPKERIKTPVVACITGPEGSDVMQQIPEWIHSVAIG